MDHRQYTSRRVLIANAVSSLIKSELNIPSIPRLIFIEEINEFPLVCVIPASERIEHRGAGYKDRYLTLKLVILVEEEDTHLEALDSIIENIETLLEEATISFTNRENNQQFVKNVSLVSIDTDEGAMNPKAIGEMVFEIHY